MTAPIAPLPIAPLPTPPSTNDPANFDTRSDAFLIAQKAMVPQLNEANEATYGNAVIAHQAALAAAPAAADAVAAALAAQAAAGLPPLPNAGRLLKTEGATNILTAAADLVAGKAYECDTSAGAFAVTLPANPAVGDFVMLTDHAGTFAAKNLTVARNGLNIMALAEDLVLDISNLSILLVYINATKGWAVK